jgi:DNA-binding transcriptional regulator YiaG
LGSRIVASQVTPVTAAIFPPVEVARIALTVSPPRVDAEIGAPKSYQIIDFSDIGFSDLTILSSYSLMRAAATWVQQGDHKIVGAALAAARQRANLTQQELARRLGKPQSFISAYEGGMRRVDVVELLVISRALGVDPLDLFVKLARLL